MDWNSGIQLAVDYIERHIAEKIDYEKVAKCAYSSVFHFQRVFGIMCGITLGEYIRRRRLTLAGDELLKGEATVTDIAFKYGYETSEGFSRAFFRFHGILPSQVRSGCFLKSFSRFNLQINLSGGDDVNYRIEEKPEIVLVGYKRRFKGVPFGTERAVQEEEFITTNRAKQWLLIGASCDYCTDYWVITNIDDEGYDFYIAYELDEWTRKELFNRAVTGVDFMEQMGFETLMSPKRTYAIFETEKKKRPVSEYVDIRRKIVGEGLPGSDYMFINAPEVVALHWRPKGIWEKERYIEICLPVERVSSL